MNRIIIIDPDINSIDILFEHFRDIGIVTRNFRSIGEMQDALRPDEVGNFDLIIFEPVNYYVGQGQRGLPETYFGPLGKCIPLVVFTSLGRECVAEMGLTDCAGYAGSLRKCEVPIEFLPLVKKMYDQFRYQCT